MSEFGIRTPELLIEVVRNRENDYEENLREEFLADRLFDVGHLLDVLMEGEMTGDDLDQLQQEFLTEKKGLNMGERFALAISDKYRGKLHVVELGSTTNPGATRTVDGLKDQYFDLRNWMDTKATDIQARELELHESGRTVAMRKPLEPDAAGKLMIMIRNRPLAVGSFEHKKRSVDFAIAKRMVFSLPIETVQALNAGTAEKNFNFNDARSLQLIETMLQHSTGGVEPIRTAYYLATNSK